MGPLDAILPLGWGLALGLLIVKYGHLSASTYLPWLGIVGVLVLGYFVRWIPGALRVIAFLVAVLLGLVLGLA